MNDQQKSDISNGGYTVESRVGLNLEARTAQAAVFIMAFQPAMMAHPDDARALAQTLLDGADAAERDAVETQRMIDAGELDEKLAEAQAMKDEAEAGVAEATDSYLAQSHEPDDHPGSEVPQELPAVRPSDMKLVEALTELGLLDLAARAARAEWNDYFGLHAMPQTHLIATLREHSDPDRADAINSLIDRVMEGEFDSGKADADEWANSDEGKEVFAALVPGSKPD